ncbi:uncharacterized protein L3040_009022 [Drepanopeziza brunnea f. sp. 'multigermtubi']|uniref:uncharacterized protein n=1 Tax=Drepanopeziza brunnea f. sp. 'multigermtubi' TaxID=698441 RepID=UPI00238346CE|nr:hypothetical protein L3040_009022 [Drepanopeziza brunnea f. sp. 'multigermtubi']
MHTPISISVLALASTLVLVVAQTSNTTGPVTGIRGNATVVENNPVGKVYTAVLPEQQFNNPQDPRGNVIGSISATANPDGHGVSFTVQFENLPTSGGPFLYHIHDDPVPSDGNCNKTLAHADPFIRGETPPCDASLPQTCQTGDLSGKYGKITSDPFTVTYKDDFASTVEGIGAFFGNRSFVIHFANKTRITCANFALAATNTTTNTTITTTPSAVPYPTGGSPTSPTVIGTANASTGAISLLLSLTAVFGLFFAL